MSSVNLLSRNRFIPPKGNIRQAKALIKAQLTRPNSNIDRYCSYWQFNEGIVEGKQIDSVEINHWNVDVFPILRMEASGGPTQWYNEVTQKTQITLSLTLGLEGTNQDDATDFFEMVVAQLYPGDRSLYDKLKPLGIMSYSIIGTGITTQKFPDGTGQIVTAHLAMLYELRTKY
jgi:hypothetical protein